MTKTSLGFTLGLLAAAIFIPPPEDPPDLEVRCIGRSGEQTRCAPAFAYVDLPDRTRLTPWALLHDLAYAAAAAGPEGCGWVLVALALVMLVMGLWTRGLLGGLRRALLTFALGVPLTLGLLYASCFLEGRQIRLGPEAVADYVPASLHSQTDRTTGLLTPADVVRWHFQRGFRVLNVSDRDEIRAGRAAAAFAAAEGFTPSLLVLVGEEWHAHPDLVLLHVRRARKAHELPLPELRQTVAEVQQEGGAVILAHPWDKLSPRTLDEVMGAGVDGVEVVNGVIHGGVTVIRAAQQHQKALVGVIDYKYGPHVNALTLLEARRAETPRGIVEALRKRETIVLFAVPGGTVTGAAYKATQLGVTGAVAGLRSLLETPRPRRGVWLAWLAGIALLWWLSHREPKGGVRRRLGRRAARILFLACCLVEYVLPAGVSWEVRAAVGTVPVAVLLGAAAIVALPLLAATHVLAREERA
ncbi:MAG: PHP domain-containing protein [Planctomycetota bacterium]